MGIAINPSILSADFVNLQRELGGAFPPQTPRILT